MKTLLALGLLLAGSASAMTPRTFLELAASDVGWSVPMDGGSYCAQIAENARKGSWPANPTSPVKYISTLTYESEHEASLTRNDVESIKGMTPNQAWRSLKGAYSRIYNGRLTPAYVFNFVLINTVDDNGPTGTSLVCVGIFSER